MISVLTIGTTLVVGLFFPVEERASEAPIAEFVFTLSDATVSHPDAGVDAGAKKKEEQKKILEDYERFLEAAERKVEESREEHEEKMKEQRRL